MTNTERVAAPESYQVKVPGSLMLFGEHAVLHSKQAIVCAINRYIYATLTPRSDAIIKINSTEFGEYITNIDNLAVSKPYDYILTAINQYAKKLKFGFALQIKSDFPPNIGFGSSAAVTAATLGILSLWLNKNLATTCPVIASKAKQSINALKSVDCYAAKSATRNDENISSIQQMSYEQLRKLHKQALKVIRLVHGVGSGADLAASIFGGVVAYKIKPIKIEKLNIKLPLTAMYCGFKTPTYKVIALVEAKRAKFMNMFTNIYNLMDSCSKNAIVAIKNNDLNRLGELMNLNQGLQDAIGVNNHALSNLIFKLRSMSNIHGAKISGSGLGDCVVGLGWVDVDDLDQEKLDLEISQSGFEYN